MTTTNIYQKLLVIQKAICGLAKDKQANSYKYVTGDKILGLIKPIMNEQGLLLKQEILSIENVRMDYKVGINTPNEKPKSEINSKVMMKFTWVDSATGEKDENLFGANGQNDWDKGVGSALTYGERYFLLKYFHIATDEDDIEMIKREEDDIVEKIKNGVIVKGETKNPEPMLKNCKTLEQLRVAYISLSKAEQLEFETLKDELKTKLK